MGSRGIKNWNSKIVRNIRDSLELTEIQKGFLIGKILGDGSLISTLTGKSFRLQVEQKAEHKDYVFWAAEIFKGWVLTQPKYLAQHQSFRFRTISHPQMTEFRKTFYPVKRKIIPLNIKKIFVHPISLAVWFMDDGSLSTSKKTVTISTHSFSREENLLLIDCLKNNFNFQANLNWDSKGNRLYIPVGNIKKFKEIVFPYMHPDMIYKLPLTP
ncbi:MAG: hypothetical protein A2271_02800 [Candidatus Moranbacteria bacterium RIFOXYA12_FULL_35_19]|nr:MAG: hypothetical protein A2343_03140 [Candidatus Moranbacteria bacterium RIFOXYB12_FULL_35_8]OGI32960.1 MAG: hypothetical protein A2489_00920 [Candidatus Moranbacteria bacterium RIFOXYC12_FULL_36_13]OGI36729.1 MAG: hypothetical protein A2271_02800 [Candidatus Moranbacteria bacterium RIFOXYA12_FULL_35_19]